MKKTEPKNVNPNPPSLEKSLLSFNKSILEFLLLLYSKLVEIEDRLEVSQATKPHRQRA